MVKRGIVQKVDALAGIGKTVSWDRAVPNILTSNYFVRQQQKSLENNGSTPRTRHQNVMDYYWFACSLTIHMLQS